jgi:endonuclease YncB( thermonuclease family)
MANTLKSLSMAAVAAVSLTTMAGTLAGDRLLSADEVKKLISGNTAHVTRVKDGDKWNVYFATDGKAYKKEGEVAGTWEVKDSGEHCVSWASNDKVRCLRIADIGGGLHARVLPNGKKIVTWKVEAGKKL